MVKLDKNRSYGEVFGTGTDAKFYQDGEHFNAAGEHLPELSSSSEVKAKPKPKPRARAKPRAKAKAKSTELL